MLFVPIEILLSHSAGTSVRAVGAANECKQMRKIITVRPVENIKNKNINFSKLELSVKFALSKFCL